MVILRVISSFIGLSCMAVTFHGFLLRDVGWVERVLYLVGGLLLVYPNILFNLIGYITVGLLVMRQVLKLKATRMTKAVV